MIKYAAIVCTLIVSTVSSWLFLYSGASSSSDLITVEVAVPVIGCPTETMGVADEKIPPNDLQVHTFLIPAADYQSGGRQMSEVRALKEMSHYVARDRDRVLAPRGWACLYSTGSSGGSFLIAPPVDTSSNSRSRPSLKRWPDPDGPGVIYYYFTSDASGQTIVSRLMALVFPKYNTSGNRWQDGVGGTWTESYPSDKEMTRVDVSYPDQAQRKRIRAETVKYITPPRLEGIGTLLKQFSPGDTPIVSEVYMHMPDRSAGQTGAFVSVFSVRMRQNSQHLIEAILRSEPCPGRCDDD